MHYTLDHIHIRCNDVDANIAYFKKMFDAKEMSIITLAMAGQRFSLSPKREEVDIRVKPGEPGCGAFTRSV